MVFMKKKIFDIDSKYLRYPLYDFVCCTLPCSIIENDCFLYYFYSKNTHMLHTDSTDNINIRLSELYVLFMQNNDFVREIGLVIKEIFGKVKPNGPS